MLNENFVIVGVLINLIGSFSYVIDTLQGKIKPNRVSWGLWAFASFVAFAAEIQQGVGIQSLMTFMVGFSPFLIFLASFVNKKSYWKLTKIDALCAILSLAGLVLWFVTKTGNIAILFSIFADLTAGVPTLIKAYQYPETESYLEFLSSTVSALLTIFTLKIFTFSYVAYPFYIFLFDITAVAFIKFKLGKKLQFRK